MKKLSFSNKLIYFINSLFAVLLLLSYATSYIKPTTFPVISALSLFVPVLLIINSLFFIYWLVGLKKQFLLSFLTLLVGFNFATNFYKFSSKDIVSTPQTDIMSYNVRLFNLYNWIKDTNTKSDLIAFIADKNPDILCLQEYHQQRELEKLYPYNYTKFTDEKNKIGQAIFSKYPIVNKGSLNFKKTSNNSIFVDVVKHNDTLRVYNIHLESLHINPEKEKISKDNSQRLLKNIGKTFSKQQAQVLLLKAHFSHTDYKTVLCADFNNTAFSWAYKNLKVDFNDAFEEAGSGFGTSYRYKNIPLRIDFILVDKKLNILDFKNHKVTFSDHYPIESRIGF
ncbi:MAG: endonuclease/exonuclease/phosphatase family protein [Flavobacteriaceae bacterium]|nr:endonuclease/exonuclease/phosphatase family protein [Flavobacteriaceae bacterium]